MSIKRYDMGKEYSLDINVIPVEESDGAFVKHEDYAALEQQLAESQSKLERMAAENAGLKEACGGDGSYRDCPACAHSEYVEAPETPATSAFLAEVRASGIDQWIASRGGRWNGTTAEAERFAAQLRQVGAQ